MAKIKSAELKLPSPHDWRTTDTDEIKQTPPARPRRDIHHLQSRTAPSDLLELPRRVAKRVELLIEIRDVGGRQFACDCVDFRINGLGTCKHVEAVLLQLERRV